MLNEDYKEMLQCLPDEDARVPLYFFQDMKLRSKSKCMIFKSN